MEQQRTQAHCSSELPFLPLRSFSCLKLCESRPKLLDMCEPHIRKAAQLHTGQRVAQSIISRNSGSKSSLLSACLISQSPLLLIDLFARMPGLKRQESSLPRILRIAWRWVVMRWCVRWQVRVQTVRLARLVRMWRWQMHRMMLDWRRLWEVWPRPVLRPLAGPRPQLHRRPMAVSIPWPMRAIPLLCMGMARMNSMARVKRWPIGTMCMRRSKRRSQRRSQRRRVRRQRRVSHSRRPGRVWQSTRRGMVPAQGASKFASLRRFAMQLFGLSSL